MNKNCLYIFVVTYGAPSDGFDPVVNYFFDRRNSPMDSHLYYRMRRRVFGLMDKTFWTARVRVFRTEEPLYVSNFIRAVSAVECSMVGIKYIGSFFFTLYSRMTCFAAFVHNGSGFRDCWNWSRHDTVRDWGNHTKHNWYFTSWRV